MDGDAALSLNIIASAPSKPKIVPRKRKLTKYDKRRAKSAKAKSAATTTTTTAKKHHQQQHSQPNASTTEPLPSDEPEDTRISHDDEDHDAMNDEEDATDENVTRLEHNSRNDTDTVERLASTTKHVDEQPDLGPLSPVSKEQKHVTVDHSQHQPTESHRSVPSRSTTTSSTATSGSCSTNATKINNNNPTLATEGSTAASIAARAAYLAEFHARPLELDRRAGVAGSNNNQTLLKQAKESQHLFLLPAIPASTTIPTTSTVSTATKEEADSLVDSAKTGWDALPLHPRLLRVVQQQQHGYTPSSTTTTTSGKSGFGLAQPTHIQRLTIAAVLKATSLSSTLPSDIPTTSTAYNDKSISNHHRRQPPPCGRSNFILQSETGSGKTLAYLLPIVHWIATAASAERTTMSSESSPAASATTTISNSNRHHRSQLGTQCLIICPTRELASQTMIVAEKLCRSSFGYIVPGCLLGDSGGEDEHKPKHQQQQQQQQQQQTNSRKAEKARIRKGLTIVIATPGRLLDHLTRTESLLSSLANLRWLVLDEADRLLSDMGLGAQIRQIQQRLAVAKAGNGTLWTSVLVSATINESMKSLASDILGLGRSTDESSGSPTPTGSKNKWIVVKGKASIAEVSKNPSSVETETPTNTSSELADSTPPQLLHLHVTVSAKLRLVALTSFLVERAMKQEKTVVFMSTCAATDYFHALFTAMDCILPGPESNFSPTAQQNGIFGDRCNIYKLHGNVPHGERQKVLRQFMNDGIEVVGSKRQSSVLLATDVAARGLNLPAVDWIVQYDPPADIADYIHRAGRVARAGRAGQCLLFVLPSEQDFLSVLKLRGVSSMSPMSLTTILNSAAGSCSSITDQGVSRSGGNQSHKRTGSNISNSRLGEAFCSELQYRLEDCVVQSDARAKAVDKKTHALTRGKGRRRGENASVGVLLDSACKAFLSFIRAYPTKEKLIRHIFPAKALHLGHVARSFALKEPPTRLASVAKKRTFQDAASTAVDLQDPSQRGKSNKKPTLEFEIHADDKGGRVSAQRNGLSKRLMSGSGKTGRPDERDVTTTNAARARSLLMANATKLQKNGLDSM